MRRRGRRKEGQGLCPWTPPKAKPLETSTWVCAKDRRRECGPLVKASHYSLSRSLRELTPKGWVSKGPWPLAGLGQQLGFYQKGTAQVRVRYVGPAPLSGMDVQPSIAANRMQTLLPPAQTEPVATGFPARPVEAANGAYSIQAGAFSDRGNAERVAARLASAGRTSVLPMDRNGARLYRVTVGSWPSAEAAGAAREQVASLGFAQARIVSGS